MTQPRRKVMVVFGTRPEAIKLAPVVLALQGSPVLEPTVVVTGQHRTMLDSVLDTFGIVPAADLDILQPGQTVTDITVRALSQLTPWLERERPDAVLVQGDTTTTFAGALGAFYQQIPVAHLEAGLRTHDAYLPFPEEISRRLTSQLTTLHLAPTATARAQLLAEGVGEQRVVVTGNTVIDALLWAVRQGGPLEPPLDHIAADERRVLLVTAHRRESWGPTMTAIGEALAEIARAQPQLTIVAPIHRNPVVREALLPPVAGLENVIVVEPLAYGPFCRLMAASDVILTDSGGIQEEAPSLGKPVLVMRDKTERPEGLVAGGARLVGTERQPIVEAVLTLLGDDGAYREMSQAGNPYGDGRGAERTVQALAHLFGLGERPADFSPADAESSPALLS